MSPGGTGLLDVTRRMFDLYEASVCNQDAQSARAFLDCWATSATVQKMRAAGSGLDINGLRIRYRGLAGVRSGLDDMVATWSEMHIAVHELERVGEDRALALTRLVGHDRLGQPLNLPTGFVLGFRDGRISYLGVHLDVYAAIDEAIGVARPQQLDWPQLGSVPQVDATFVASTVMGYAVLEVAGSWYVDVPVPEHVEEHVVPGTAALVYFRENGRVAGWYIPDAQVGVDLRGIAGDRRAVMT